MIFNIHSDASYLLESRARSRAAGHYFLGSIPDKNKPIKLNGAIHSLCQILKFVAASAAEAELGALYLNVKQGRIIRLALEEMGHPQPPTPINCDSLTTTGIVNGTVKRQRSRSMEKNYFYVIDQVDNKQFIVEWYPGHENLGDYISKHHEEKHHKEVRNIYLHDENSPRYLKRAKRPSLLRGCVGTGRKGGIRPAPLTQLRGQQAK